MRAAGSTPHSKHLESMLDAEVPSITHTDSLLAELEASDAMGWEGDLEWATENPCFAEAVEHASTATHVPTWLSQDMHLKLCPDRWRHWGEAPAGSIGQVSWTWIKDQPPARSDHPNHKSAQQHAQLLGKQLDECVSMGMVELCPPGMAAEQFAHNILPLGARVKPSGAVRMLVDPSLPGVNQAMASLPCELPSVESIFAEVQPGEVLGKRDLLNGFFHLVLAPEARKHMAFRHPVSGALARWVVLPQGTKQSPALFCAVSQASARIFNELFAEKGIKCKVYVYVDDYILRAKSFDDLLAAFDAMDEEAVLLGLCFNPAKDVGRDQPLTCIEALGICMDSVTMSISLPESKRASYLQCLCDFESQFKGSPACSRKPLEQLVGKLVFACRVCTWGYLFIQEILDQLYPVGHPTAPRVSLSEGLWHDLGFWQFALGDGFATWMGVKQHALGRKEVAIDPSRFTAELFTDASGSWGVGAVMGLQSLSQQWGRDTSSEHIGALELEALHVALQHWREQLRGHIVLARLDNVQAVVAINKGCSRKLALRGTLLAIAKLGLEYSFTVKAKHVRGVHNPADAPSRGKGQHSPRDMVCTAFTEFNQPQATVDCCAAPSGYNTMPGCTRSFSSVAELQTNLRDLAGQVLWANIPWAEVAEHLAVLKAAYDLDPAHTIVTCVVPDWPTTSWYRKYLRRRKPAFKVIKAYPPGARLFQVYGSLTAPAPCPHGVLIIRMGERT